MYVIWSEVCVLKVTKVPFLELGSSIVFFVFFFNDTATTEIYTLSLHDALPISNYNHLTGVKYVKSAKPSQTIKYQLFLSIKYREKVTC